MAEITINDVEPLDQYTAAGGETEYDYNFPIFDADDLVVLQITDAGVVTTLVRGTDYTVSGVGVATGGTMTFDTGVYPSGVTANYRYVLYRDLAVSRGTDFLTGGDFKAATVNRELDKIIMMIQQNELEIKRSLGLQKADVEDEIKFEIETAAERQERALQFSADGSRVEAGPSTTDINNAATNAATATAQAVIATTKASEATASAASASSSASAAAASAAEGLYNDVVSKTFADSPFEPSASEDGDLYRIDTSGGSVVVNLDELSDYGEDVKFAFVKTTSDANTITVNRGGSDTIEGGTSVTITEQYEVHVFVGDSASGTWLDTVHATAIQDGSVTTVKLANEAVETAKIDDGAVTTAKLADTSVTFAKVASSTISNTSENQAGTATDKIPTVAGVKESIDQFAAAKSYTHPSQATTSGTSKDFTLTLSGVNEIEVIFDDNSLSGTDNIIIQIGDAGGIETTGYDSYAVTHNSGGAVTNITNGYMVRIAKTTGVLTGSYFLRLSPMTSNKWAGGGVLSVDSLDTSQTAAGKKTLSDTITTVRVTINGSDTFDGGAVTIRERVV